MYLLTRSLLSNINPIYLLTRSLVLHLLASSCRKEDISKAKEKREMVQEQRGLNKWHTWLLG